MFGKMKEGKLRLAATITAALGAGVMAYLTRLHFSDSGGGSVCDLSAELSCGIVNKSLYSEVVGIPLAILGLVFFLTVIYILWLNPVKKPWKVILLFSIFSLVFGLYLSAIEQFVLGSVCIFCEISKLLMIVLIVLSAYGVRSRKEKLPTPWIIGVILVALVFSWVVYMIQRPPEIKKDYSGLASCLTENDVHMYGAYWCQSCAKQKRDLGPAFEKISYIECDPRGENSQVERCVERDISKTPTWIQEKDGEDMKHLVGAHSPEKLAEFFGCSETL